MPPECHRRNAAEVVIRNFKAHFLSVLAGMADDLPPSLWDWFLPQAEITVDLLQQSNATPNVSAYAHLSGPFDYNKIPLAPMGCAVQVHKKTDKRGPWTYHSVDGWYLATSPEHYRTHMCHIKQMRSKWLTNTIQFSHKKHHQADHHSRRQSHGSNCRVCQGDQRNWIQQWQGQDAAAAPDDRRGSDQTSRSGSTAPGKINKKRNLRARKIEVMGAEHAS